VEPPAYLAKEESPREEQRAPRHEPRVEVPRIDPKPILESAGLVMIETDRSKAATVAPQPEEPVQLGRPRRERPKATTQEDELQQVETKR